MSHKNTFSIFPLTLLKRAAVVIGCMTFAFFVGIQTAGEVHIETTKAGSLVISGDLNGNDRIDVGDAKRALEIAQGFEPVTTHDLEADPNQDSQITVADALAILNELSH